MSTGLALSNLATYGLQIGILIALASVIPALLRLKMAAARLIFWQALLAICLTLPLLHPWQQRVADLSGVQISTTVTDVQPAKNATSPTLPRSELVLLLLAAGIAARMLWLAGGFWKLRQYRKHGRPAISAVPFDTRSATVLLSDQVSSPVTFGVRKPVILLPDRFPSLEPALQRAILCHELLHVQRRDWLFTLAEELVRSVFWFHPAIWWLLGEIQLAREQAVDHQVIASTQARDQYLDALLAIAGANPRLDLAPAPLFLRKRHLKQRVVSILKEVHMTKVRWMSALAAGLGILVAACWFVTNTFPLAAAPQIVADAPGVTVDLRGAALVHRAPVGYPADARSKGVQGTVLMDARLDGSGNVIETHVLSGPDELRGAAQQSVLQWHFQHDFANSTRQVSITFQLPAEKAAVTPQRQPVPAPASPAHVQSITISGISDQARQELLSSLPVHEGDTIQGQDSIKKMAEAVKQFDEHLDLRALFRKPGEVTFEIQPKTAVAPNTTVSSLGPIKIGGTVQQAKLITQVRPIYPPEAKASRTQGLVELEAIIAADGTIRELKVLSGDPVLAQAAMDAVKQWVYQTTLLNGEPVEVKTTIDVNFTLSQ